MLASPNNSPLRDGRKGHLPQQKNSRYSQELNFLTVAFCLYLGYWKKVQLTDTGFFSVFFGILENSWSL